MGTAVAYYPFLWAESDWKPLSDTLYSKSLEFPTFLALIGQWQTVARVHVLRARLGRNWRAGAGLSAGVTVAMTLATGTFGDAALGVQALPALADVIDRNDLFARVEVGSGTSRLQGYVVTQLSLYNVAAWYEQADDGGPYVIVGDALFAQGGLGARAPFAVWRLRLVPHLDVGVVHVSTPFDPVAYEDDVLERLGEDPSVGRSALGAWAQLGGDVGPTLAARLGLAARF